MTLTREQHMAAMKRGQFIPKALVRHRLTFKTFPRHNPFEQLLVSFKQWYRRHGWRQ